MYSPLELLLMDRHLNPQGVQEPPDFVNCQGIQLMRDGGIQVESVEKMGDACLKAARRGQQ